MEVYSRINHVGVCVGYSVTVKLVEEVSQLFMVPLQNWMQFLTFGGTTYTKNVGFVMFARTTGDIMVHMYSMLVGRSRTPAIELPCTGHLAHLDSLPTNFFFLTASDVQAVMINLVVIVSRLISGISIISPPL